MADSQNHLDSPYRQRRAYANAERSVGMERLRQRSRKLVIECNRQNRSTPIYGDLPDRRYIIDNTLQ